MTGEMIVGGERVEKWHMKPLGVSEGDRLRFTWKRPKADSLSEKLATVEEMYGETVAVIDVEGASNSWMLRHGAVQIIQDGRRNRYHGSLADVEKIPTVGSKVVTDTGVVGEVVDVNLETDNAQIDRTFDPTIYWESFENITREVR